MRLSGRRQFAAVYDGKVRASAGPLMVYGIANELKHPRLGLAVPRRVGTAVKRNTIKRRLREAFRFMQHDWPAGYDVVINVRAHEPLHPTKYQELLTAAVSDLHASWLKKQHQSNPPSRA